MLTDAELRRVLVVDDEGNLRHMLRVLLEKNGYQVDEAADGVEALRLLDQGGHGVVLCDIRMPELDGPGFLARAIERGYPGTFIMMSAYATIDTAVDCMKKGAYDFISKPFRPDEVLLALQKATERCRLMADNVRLRRSQSREAGAGGIVFRSRAMAEVMALAGKVAGFKTSVLITGESGTGKELIARAIHDASPRSSRPFVAVNCAAIPEPLLESELFGHVRGAFTDAVADRAGLFEAAHGGTLFLDEIGDMPPALQVKLLRVLQDEQIRRLGGSAACRVDVRIISATSRNLAEAVAGGGFREDLLFRLNVFHLALPPLRERREDIPLLVEHLLAKHGERYGSPGVACSPQALRILSAHPWPGNVRELENALERALVLCTDGVLEPGAFSWLERPGEEDLHLHGLPPDSLSIKKAEEVIERRLIRRALLQTGGNRTQAARLLEISLRSLLYKIKEFGLE
jgi:two-component system response regulator AtoC